MDSHYTCHICGVRKPVSEMVPELVTRCKECHVAKLKDEGRSYFCKPDMHAND